MPSTKMENMSTVRLYGISSIETSQWAEAGRSFSIIRADAVVLQLFRRGHQAFGLPHDTTAKTAAPAHREAATLKRPR